MKKIFSIFQRKNLRFFLFAGLFLLIVIPLGYFAYSKLNPKKPTDIFSKLEQLTSPEAEKKARSVVEDVAKLIKLPEGEIPSVATITDLSQLPNHEFYRFAKVGDKMLIYSQAHKIILYRPSEKIIIDVAPVEFASEKPTPIPNIGEEASISAEEKISTPSGTNRVILRPIQQSE